MSARALVAIVALAVLGGCTGLAPPAPRDAAPDALVARCERLYVVLDEAVAAAGVPDGGEARLAGYPYARVDRLLASFGEAPLDAAALQAWVDALIGLDRAARRAELDNVPRSARPAVAARLAADGWPENEPAALIEGCSRVLRDHDLADPRRRDRLLNIARVPDDYDTWKRVVGLYVLASFPFAYGVSRYQDGVQATFDTPLEGLPVRGTLVRYAPPEIATLPAGEVGAIIARSSRGPLGIPRPEGEDLARLLGAFAPVLEVDVADADDRIGYPVIGADRVPTVDVARPVAFTRVAHARVGDRVLLQLVYSFWFPARPRTSALDPLGGSLDGVTWRVTLGIDGYPVLFDSMHNCGCYHMFFPTPRAALRRQPYTIEETAFVPQRLPAAAPPDRLVLRVASRTHYLERVTVAGRDPAGARRYGLAADETLRSIPGPDGAGHSLFRPDGIVPGTERGERWLFWPMGVREPGAMRQWGRHATAFVGRRHFDDPWLVERYFVILEP
ncbi:MAG: hypothetical protein ACM36B_19955 [Bacteroidota bacterium]